jgi:hypothetical protein
MQEITDIYQINTGDNLAVSTDSFVGHTIADFQKCQWNHSAKFLWQFGKLYVVEAGPEGEVLTLFSHYTSQPKKYKLMLQKQHSIQTEDDIHKWVHYALQRCGNSKYGYSNLVIAQPVKLMFHIWIGAKTLRQVENRGFICGQFVAYLDQLTYGYYPFNRWIPLAPVDLVYSPNYTNFIINIPS